MYPSYLQNYVINENQSALEALWMLEKQNYFLSPPSGLAVLNDKGEFVGVVTKGKLSQNILHLEDITNCTVNQICNRSAIYVQKSERTRNDALNIFADNPIVLSIPVINEKMNLIDIVFRQQSFYKDFYLKGELPKFHYARQIYEAALLAKDLGYDAFSVIEFGVAGGQGLIACEFHINEIARLLNVNIQLYGFDTGGGYPETIDPRDSAYKWTIGSSGMDIERLRRRLQFAQLVMGDICETAGEFMHNANFAPIGAMFAETGCYTVTAAILNMLRGGLLRNSCPVYI